MDKIDINIAAGLLRDHWLSTTRLQHLPESCAPKTRIEAYAIQAAMMGGDYAPLFGWKIAATSVAGQKHIGVDGPLAGRYIPERVVASGGRIPFGNNNMKVAEVEFAFRLGIDLPPRNHLYTEHEVFAAVASLHPAIEIPDSRYDRFEVVGAEALIADNACAHWLCVGEAMPEVWRAIDLAAFTPVGRVKGRPDVTGKGANVLGSPRIAMTWLVNELSAHGIAVRSGETVTTGTCLAPMAIAAGDHITGDFAELGRVEVSLED